MKTPALLLATAAALGLFGLAGRATAQATAAYPPPAPGNDDALGGPLYHAQELSVDMYGTGTVYDHGRFDDHGYYDHDRWHRDARGGGGVGLNYFFSRYVGVGADTYTEGEEPFIYSASGNVIVRVPILDTGLAPYVFGGGGYQFDLVRQDFGQAGGGLEYRFTRHIGIFADARYVVAGEGRNYGLGRAGLRFSF